MRKRKGTKGRHPEKLHIDNFLRDNVATIMMRPEPHDDSATVLYLDLEELEVLRLCDYEGLYQQEAATRMKTSRGTIWRLLQSARKKMMQAIIENKTIYTGMLTYWSEECEICGDEECYCPHIAKE